MWQWLKNWISAKPAPAPEAAPVEIVEATPPVIGISGANSDSASVRAMMTQIRDTGAVPLFLGNHTQRDAAADLQKIDALIVMGNNGDINPAYYGEAAHPKTNIETDRAREQYEFAMLAGAIDQKMPTLGVCGGMQRINVLLGGSLHQHVPDVAGESILHNQGDAGIAPFCPVQLVHVEPDTELARAARGIRSAYRHSQKPGEDGMVQGGFVPENSMHHQAVNRVGTGLRVSARSEDGVTEAIEPAQGSPLAGQFLLGVQWHPEFGASPLGPRIAQGLAAAAQDYAQSHSRTHPMHQAVEESLLSSMPAIKSHVQVLRLQPAAGLQSSLA